MAEFDSEKTWHMKATCSFKDHKPFKKLKVGGKNVLSAAKSNMYYAKMKLAGKKASVKYTLNKGYKFYGMKGIHVNDISWKQTESGAGQRTDYSLYRWKYQSIDTLFRIIRISVLESLKIMISEK